MKINKRAHWHSLCIFFPKNRRGSHVDVIISFIIFISFIVFAYAILQPTLTTQEGKTTLASSMYTALINNLSSGSNLTFVSVAANQNSQHNCLQLINFLTNTNLNNPRIIVRNSSGAVFTAYNSSGDLYIDITSNHQLTSFFSIYYSPSFNLIPSGTLPSCGALQQGNPPNNYIIGQISSSSSKYILDFNIIQLVKNYNQSYGTVKSWFNLSAPDNFGFNFTYQNQTIIGTSNKIPPFTNVYAEGFPVLYLANNNSLQSGLLTIRVW